MLGNRKKITNTQEFNHKKIQLLKLRSENENNFPPFLDDLLNNGYEHLYDHLIEMKSLTIRHQRTSVISKMSFSAASHIILDTRSAIIQHVEDIIPSNHSENIIFLLGATGSGKSTTVCFLRGDEMVLHNFNYKSKSGSIIGEQNGQSCTFLPNIEITSDFVLVDFPGFEDTNGSFIELGIEFAMKALINKYHPKILVIESIINSTTGYASIGKLTSRLSRILDHTQQSCLLGLTQYARDPYYKAYKNLEIENAKINKDSLSSMEEVYQEEIEKLYEILKEPNDLSQKKKEKHQHEIKKIQSRLEVAKIKRIENTEKVISNRLNEIIINKELLHQQENEILKITRLKSLIRFDSLDNKDTRHLCLQELKKASHTPTKLNLNHQLASEAEKLLEDLFIESYINNQDENNQPRLIFDNFEALRKHFEQTSLIHAVLSIETGELLHLPEMDPLFVHKLDRQLIEKFLNKYKRSLLALNLSKMKNFVYGLLQTEQSLELCNQLNSLENYLRGLFGENDDKKWLNSQSTHEYLVTDNDVNALFALPKWINAFSYIETALPESIVLFAKNIFLKQNPYLFYSDALLGKCSDDIHALYCNLYNLQHIHNMLAKTLIDVDTMKINYKFKSKQPSEKNWNLELEKKSKEYQKWMEIWDAEQSLSPEERIINILKEYTRGQKPASFFIWETDFDRVFAIFQDKHGKKYQKSAIALLTELKQLQLKKPKESLAIIIAVIKDKLTLQLDMKSLNKSHFTRFV